MTHKCRLILFIPGLMIIKKVLAFERDLRRKIIIEEENKNRILGHDQEDSSPLPIGRSRMHI